MIDYCIRDVELTERLYIALQPHVHTIRRQCIDLEYEVRRLVSQQERNGFSLDMQKATCLVAKLKDRSDSIESEVTAMFPPIPVLVREVTPKIKKDGSLSTVGLRHIEDIAVVAGVHSAIDYQEFNLSSRQQIVKRLLSKGWQPNKFTDKGHPIVDEGVLKDVDLPEAKKIAEFLMLRKRIAQIQSWIDAVKDDGKVHGQVLTLRAISGRMAHHSPNMAQVPASYSPYGKECRECWISGDTSNLLVGCDASSLELRALAHYLEDSKFTKEVVDGDIHTANQHAAGLETRDQAKTFIYAFIYGAGAAKIGTVVGGTAQDGQRLIDTFLSNVPALATLRQRVDAASNRGFLIGLDGRKLIVRNKHSAVNLLIQGAGAVICKQWLVDIHDLLTYTKIKARLVASIHDEYQHEINKEQAEEFGELTKLAMRKTQERLGIKCPLDSEYKIGHNWSETH
jgi:DNA polymerase I-like protein with 3'-5' exonuclease and polymerase domains